MSGTGHEIGITQVAIDRVRGTSATPGSDELSIEQPLAIRVVLPERGPARTLSVTMRTPGDDLALAAGFLFGEEVIDTADDLLQLRQGGANSVVAWLGPNARPDAANRDPRGFVSSSCGACGKLSIATSCVGGLYKLPSGRPRIAPELIHTLPAALRAGQSAFERTGGMHASGLFDMAGRLLRACEDVGRHNALDKVIGAELRAGQLPLSEHILLVSGRVSFELVQKAIRAGLAALAAVGAPSSLAVELAGKAGMTLVGFVRDGRFNVYSDRGRIT